MGFVYHLPLSNGPLLVPACRTYSASLGAVRGKTPARAQPVTPQRGEGEAHATGRIPRTSHDVSSGEFNGQLPTALTLSRLPSPTQTVRCPRYYIPT